jgi:hypothetical protein
MIRIDGLELYGLRTNPTDRRRVRRGIGVRCSSALCSWMYLAAVATFVLSGQMSGLTLTSEHMAWVTIAL